MSAALAELKEGERLFPLSKPIAEGIQGAVEEARSYTDTKLDPLRGDVAGINRRMQDMTSTAAEIDAKAGTIERAAGEASSSAQHAASVADIAKGEAERAAESAQAAQASLREMSERVDTVPQLAVKALEGVVKATVTDSDEKGKEVKVEKKGHELIQHLSNGIENARAAAGRASADAEECKTLIEEAKEIIRTQGESNDETAKALDDKVTAAEGAASRTAGAAAEVKAAFDAVSESVEALKIQVSVIAAVLLGKASIKDPDTRAVLESAMETEEGES